MLRSLSFFFGFSSWAANSNGALIHPTVILPTTHLPNSTSFPQTLNASKSEYHCTRSKDWNAPGFDPLDCAVVVDTFRAYEEKHHGHEEYEFLLPGARREYWVFKPQLLPRQYRSTSVKTNSCTMKLVMMVDPKIADVEGRSRRRYHYASNDVSSYYHIWIAASELLDHCIGKFGLPGVITVGEQYSIGIFLLATGSNLDKQIEIGRSLGISSA